MAAPTLSAIFTLYKHRAIESLKLNLMVLLFLLLEDFYIPFTAWLECGLFCNGTLQNLISAKQPNRSHKMFPSSIPPYRQSLFKVDEKCMHSAKVRRSQITTGLNDLWNWGSDGDKYLVSLFDGLKKKIYIYSFL